jgi:hypothetical protein
MSITAGLDCRSFDYLADVLSWDAAIKLRYFQASSIATAKVVQPL